MGFGEGRVMWINNDRNGMVIWDHNNNRVISTNVTVTVR